MDNAIHEGTEDADSQAADKEHFDQSKFDKPLDIADIAIGKALDSVLDQGGAVAQSTDLAEAQLPEDISSVASLDDDTSDNSADDGA